jgi:hypothetical protein
MTPSDKKLLDLLSTTQIGRVGYIIEYKADLEA